MAKRNLLKILIFLALAVFGSTAAEALQTKLGPEWVKAEGKSDAGIWKLKKQPTTTVAVLKQPLDEAYDFSKYTSDKLARDQERVRKDPLAVYGIKDWNIRTHSLSKGPAVTVFEISGSYVGAAGNQVQFVEKQYYFKNEMVQVTYSQEGPKSKLDLNTAKKILARVEVTK